MKTKIIEILKPTHNKIRALVTFFGITGVLYYIFGIGGGASWSIRPLEYILMAPWITLDVAIIAQGESNFATMVVGIPIIWFIYYVVIVTTTTFILKK